jgi:hypothetical protein
VPSVPSVEQVWAQAVSSSEPAPAFSLMSDYMHVHRFDVYCVYCACCLVFHGAHAGDHGSAVPAKKKCCHSTCLSVVPTESCSYVLPGVYERHQGNDFTLYCEWQTGLVPYTKSVCMKFREPTGSLAPPPGA